MTVPAKSLPKIPRENRADTKIPKGIKNPFGLVYDGAIEKKRERQSPDSSCNLCVERNRSGGGTPRLRDYPANRINDISGMVDYLVSLPKVDSSRIGSLGICGGGGYTLAASQTDKRIRAVATLSMFNSGRVRRNGFQDSQISTIQERLLKASQTRNKELEGEIQYEGFLPAQNEDELRKIMEGLPEGLYKDGIDYYGISYKHPKATGSYTTESFLKLMVFDVEDRMDLVSRF